MPKEFPRLTEKCNWQGAFASIEPLSLEPPFSESLIQCIVHLVDLITDCETKRGSIMRTERSALCSEAQPIQDLLDRIIFRLAGLTDSEAEGLEQRLSKML